MFFKKKSISVDVIYLPPDKAEEILAAYDECNDRDNTYTTLLLYRFWEKSREAIPELKEGRWRPVFFRSSPCFMKLAD